MRATLKGQERAWGRGYVQTRKDEFSIVTRPLLAFQMLHAWRSKVSSIEHLEVIWVEASQLLVDM